MILRVAVNAPLRRLFDYLPPPGSEPGPPPSPGVRVRVPFGRGQRVGILIEVVRETEVPAARLRVASSILDEEPVLDQALLRLLGWAADYYHHFPGEVFQAALPALLRKGRPTIERISRWSLTATGRGVAREELARRAPRQAELLDALGAAAGGLTGRELAALHAGWRDSVGRMLARGWVEETTEPMSRRQWQGAQGHAPMVLTPPQEAAARAIIESLDRYRSFLLFGVTGSGKTEVYLEAVAEANAKGMQALVLVPEIGLTPQLLARFRNRLGGPLAVMHSGLTERERLESWRLAASGDAPVIIGTRSAVFAPLPRPGMIIVDEEHDTSYKQQDGFRYSARDLAVLRARGLGIPVVLGTATPALETLHNSVRKRYRRLDLPERPGNARHPKINTIDLRHHAVEDGLSTPLIMGIARHLEQEGQVMLYLNRRGFAPALFCSDCGWIARCQRCDANMTLHRPTGKLHCHHCDALGSAPELCPDCRTRLKPVGEGTQRIEEALARRFPEVPLVRIDRDSTQRRGAMEEKLGRVRSGQARILVGTQMLTKGHDFPDVTLVGVINADQGLFGTDFRASERLAQTIVQVAGRAGRAEKPGEVMIQSLYPEHPLLQKLIAAGYEAFATAALEERRAATWPPYTHLALLRAEAAEPHLPLRFLARARGLAAGLADGVEILGPAPAPMERRAGRYRAQLLLQSASRTRLQAVLTPWIAAVGESADARRVRWALDVDPVELF